MLRNRRSDDVGVGKYDSRKEKGMKVAMCQMANHGSMDKNIEHSLGALAEAAREGADLILYPEVHLTEFFPQYPGGDARKYAVDIDGAIVKKFRKHCREHGIMAVPNIYLREGDCTYDASILIGRDGSILGIQKMVHVAQAEKFYEQDYYTPSDEGFKVFEIDEGKVGIVVCYDRHYPESIRTEALMGADLILVPTVNTKAEPMAMFEKELQVQAFHNGVAIAMCNRVGTEDAMDFAGESVVVDADGSTVIKAGNSEELVYCNIDLSESRKVRKSRDYTTLRRTEFYR
jgi:predicted amidohydrolase